MTQKRKMEMPQLLSLPICVCGKLSFPGVDEVSWPCPPDLMQHLTGPTVLNALFIWEAKTEVVLASSYILHNNFNIAVQK